MVAGLFYPAGREGLARTVDELLDRAGAQPDPAVRGLVAPHAGYTYSGPVAAAAYSRAPAEAEEVVLLGPSHFVPLVGLAVSGADAWATPLGEVPVSSRLREAALAVGAAVDESPHTQDHALEVQLPFLQRVYRSRLEILPVAVGRTAPEEVASLLAALEALAVVSTDLSHYLPEDVARRRDRETADAVLRCDPTALAEDCACGVSALRGLVAYAQRERLEVELLDLRSSADTGRGGERVVGYGAFAVRGEA
jgi:hypothetical protein